MKLALASFNPTVGDIQGNRAGMARMIDRARDAGASLIVFPELSLTGYPPKDLLLQEGFLPDVASKAKALGESSSGGITVVFGAPLPTQVEPGAHDEETVRAGTGIANSLLAYRDGVLLDYYDKRLLPTYDVFDEDRYFVPGERAVCVDVGGTRVGLTICEDLWRAEDVGFASRYSGRPDPVAELMRPDAGGRVPDLIINPSASPFVLGKGCRHRDILRKHAVANGVWVAAINQVGGNDDLIFDGASMVFGPAGDLRAAGPLFDESILYAEVGPRRTAGAEAPATDPLATLPDEELLFRALVLGVRDFLRKVGFKSAVLGLSGGIDSAVTAVIAAAALGPENVLGVGMPSRYSSPGSKSDAEDLAARVGCRYVTIPIEPAFNAMLGLLADSFQGCPSDMTEENIQSRIRGVLLMGLSNKHRHMLLTTGNKSELAVGYCTLYGDMNGGLAVLSDVTKQWVYRLARWINAHPTRLGMQGLSRPPIPETSITKPPSAELRPNQTDQDTLPPYEVLDEIIERYIERRQSASHIIAEMCPGKTDEQTVLRCIRMMDGSEFKRKQAALGLKVTGIAFGSGRRFPIAQRYRGGLGSPS